MKNYSWRNIFLFTYSEFIIWICEFLRRYYLLAFVGYPELVSSAFLQTPEWEYASFMVVTHMHLYYNTA